MSTHFRPAIQNGKVHKRSTGSSTRLRQREGHEPGFQWPQFNSAIALPGRLPSLTEIGEWSHQGLAFFGLDRHRIAENTTTESTGSRAWVVVSLLACGALLAGGFVFSLRDRFTTYAYTREEVKLKSQFDQVSSERRFLDASLSRAASLSEVSRAAEQSNAVKAVQLDRRLTPKPPAAYAAKGERR